MTPRASKTQSTSAIIRFPIIFSCFTAVGTAVFLFCFFFIHQQPFRLIIFLPNRRRSQAFEEQSKIFLHAQVGYSSSFALCSIVNKFFCPVKNKIKNFHEKAVN